MDGVHDLGGKHGFGKVEREVDEPAFHERWEAKVFAMVPAARRAGAFDTADRFRHSVERIDPVAYLSHGYYGRWLGGVETLFVEAGTLTTAEVSAKAIELGASPDDLVAARPNLAPESLAQGGRGVIRELSHPAKFHIDDVVITDTTVKSGHTRLPAYARGKIGRIHAIHGGWVYPDTSAHGKGDHPTYLYTVEFSGEELWGDGADPGLFVCIDLFEPYLSAIASELAE